jgi:bifunctional non-homologous end joining protein LigD
VERDGDRVRLITRGGYDWAKRYPWIVETALNNRQRRFVIDGEAANRKHPAMERVMDSFETSYRTS